VLDRIRLTYKQQRFETVAVAAVCLGAAAWALLASWHLNSIGVPASCLVDGRVPYWNGPSDSSWMAAACQLPSQRFTDALNSWDVQIVSSLGDVLPFFVGIAMGAPLVAREIEDGTAQLSWALAGARWKWLAGRILAALLLIVSLLLIAGLAADLLRGAQEPGVDPHASLDYFTSRGVFFVLWGVAALMGTVALGVLFGRTMPVVIVALIACVLARATWEPLMDAYVLHGMAVLEMPGVSSPGELQVYQSDVLYLDGKVYTGTDCWLSNGVTGCQYNSGDEPDPSSIGPQPAWYVITGDNYWRVVALESAIMLAGSALFAAFALFRVGRRKPY
jgi:ABC-2 family transporter protein